MRRAPRGGRPAACGRGGLARARRRPAARPRPRRTRSAGCRSSTTSRGRGPQQPYDALVARRAAREPLQHLTGTAAFRHLELAVGPGVFVPRPETELLAGWAIEQARAGSTGRGRRRPLHRVGSDRAGRRPRGPRRRGPRRRARRGARYAWAARNLSRHWRRPAPGRHGRRVRRPRGTVDVVVCNPPYIPLEAWESVAAEARDHDPHLALFSGDDGLDAIRVLEQRAARAAAARGSGRRRARRRPGRVRAGASSRPPGAGSTWATTETSRVAPLPTARLAR